MKEHTPSSPMSSNAQLSTLSNSLHTARAPWLVATLVSLLPLACSSGAIEDDAAAGQSFVDGEFDVDQDLAADAAEPSGSETEEVAALGSELGFDDRALGIPTWIACGNHEPGAFLRYQFTNSNQGFRLDGIYEAGANAQTFPVDRAGTAFGGRLYFLASTAESNAVGAPSPQGYTYVDFVSPNPKGWEGYYAFQYDIQANVVGAPVYAQLRLVAEKCRGGISHFVDVDASGRPEFCQIGSAFTTCTSDLSNLTVPLRDIKEVRIRVYFPTYTVIGEGWVALDNVRPVP